MVWDWFHIHQSCHDEYNFDCETWDYCSQGGHWDYEAEGAGEEHCCYCCCDDECCFRTFDDVGSAGAGHHLFRRIDWMIRRGVGCVDGGTFLLNIVCV
jgi:hypothetical protein